MSSIILRNGALTKNPRLDCIPQFDDRSRKFLSRNLLEPDAPIVSRAWDLGVYLDQGNEGACVGFGFSHELAAEPVPVQGIDNNFARSLYRRAQQIDEWPGERYEGTSVLAGAKACQEIGDIDAYFWATSAREVAQALANIGPVVIGVNWYEGMEDVDSCGFITPAGSVRGGHCVCLRAVVNTSGLDDGEFFVIGRNSWGRSWGIEGEFKLHEDSLQKLVDDAGSAFCVPTSRADTGKWPEARKRRWFDFLNRRRAASLAAELLSKLF